MNIEGKKALVLGGYGLVGMAVMAELQCATLILTPSTVAARQWRAELLDKTTLREQDIGEYTGQTKEIRPVTLSTSAQPSGTKPK